jgi:hypothetical protein
MAQLAPSVMQPRCPHYTALSNERYGHGKRLVSCGCIVCSGACDCTAHSYSYAAKRRGTIRPWTKFVLRMQPWFLVDGWESRRGPTRTLGVVDHWKLVKDSTTPDWYYYHERSLTGTTEYKNYRWAFYRHYDPCCPCLRVFRKYPGENWTYVCCACFRRLPGYAASSEESRRANSESQP